MKTLLMVSAMLIGSIRLLAVEGLQAVDEKEFAKVAPAAAVVKKLAGDLQFTEGPVWIPRSGGFLVFSDIPADKLMKWSEKDGLGTFRHPSHNANGNILDLEGRLITCEHTSRRVTRAEADGSVTTLADRYNGKKLNSPNDVAVKSDGTIWFTDPPYGIQRELKEQPGNYVYCLNPASKDLRAVATDFDMPNGLCFSPDEKRLYVADSGKPHHLRVFDVQSDNTLKGGQVFCVIDKGGPDGIRCDALGHVLSSAGDGVQVFGADGQLIGRILVPESPANLCFGGPEFKTLYITARKSLYAVELKVQGARVGK